jgi:hypothetical protein
MFSVGVVVHFNVLKELGSGIFQFVKGTTFQQICFQPAKEVFHGSIVIGVIGQVHLLLYFSFHQQGGKRKKEPKPTKEKF